MLYCGCAVAVAVLWLCSKYPPKLKVYREHPCLLPFLFRFLLFSITVNSYLAMIAIHNIYDDTTLYYLLVAAEEQGCNWKTT